jgi:hypothetical protein
VSLSASERLSVFEILDFPPGVTVVEMWGELGRSNAVEQYAFTSPVSAIDGRIAALTAEMETRVRELIAEWKLVATSEVRLDRAEDVEGIVQDAEAKRALVRKRLQVYVPVYLEDEILARHGNMARGAAGNRIMRG